MVIVGLNKQYVIMVSLDFIGMASPTLDEIADRLTDSGFSPDRLVISNTHTHNAPDTLGIWGKGPLSSGINPVYREFIIQRTTKAVLAAAEQMQPAQVRLIEQEVDIPSASPSHLLGDSRRPIVVDDKVRAIFFETPDGYPIGTLVNWISHPEAAGSSHRVSSDFVYYVRDWIEQQTGAPAAYFSGAVGGLIGPLSISLPLLDEEGQPVLDEHGQPVIQRDNNFDKARSYGFTLAQTVLQGLEKSEPQSIDLVQIRNADIIVPAQNMILLMAMLIGLLEKIPLELDQPDFCGLLACVPTRLSDIRIGNAQIVTFPGEVFPESFFGREASSHDFGEQWGIKEYPAIDGVINYLEGDLRLHFGLAHFELGYLVPASDYHLPNHPDYYEESFCLGRRAELVIRQELIGLLNQPPAVD